MSEKGDVGSDWEYQRRKERKHDLGRRGVLKGIAVWAAALGLGYAGYRAVENKDESRRDLENPDTFKEFLGTEGTYYLSTLQGEVKLRKGATIHERPTYHHEEAPQFPFTAGADPDTQIASIGTFEDVFTIKDPFLILREAKEGHGGQDIKEIVNSEGKKIFIDSNASWVVFSKEMSEDISEDLARKVGRARFEIYDRKVACVIFDNVMFQGKDQENFSSPLPIDSLGDISGVVVEP